MSTLTKPSLLHKFPCEKMLAEWSTLEDVTDSSPWTLFYGNSYEEFLQYVNLLNENSLVGRVPATLFFVMLGHEIVRVVDIRHEIGSNVYLKNFGGHIGYDIAPKFRGKWYATEALCIARWRKQKIWFLTMIRLCLFFSIRILLQQGLLRKMVGS